MIFTKLLKKAKGQVYKRFDDLAALIMGDNDTEPLEAMVVRLRKHYGPYMTRIGKSEK